MSLGFFTAAVFTATLSAPLRSISAAVSIDLIPPPTVIGIKTSLAAFETKSFKLFLP